MLCASIFSEVVLGFLLWTGWLGSTQPMAYNEADCSCAPCCWSAPCICPVGCPCMGNCPCGTACPCPPGACPSACPSACPTACPPAPIGKPDVVANISLTAARPKHLPPCQVNLPLLVDGTPTTNTFPLPVAGKVGHCSITARVAERCPEGVVLELSCHSALQDQGCETYKARQKVHFNTPTGVVLGGNGPEPVCAAVLVRPAADALVAHPVPTASPYCPYPIVQAPFGCLPMPVPMPVPPAGSACLPEPLPLPQAPVVVAATCVAPARKAPCAHVCLVHAAGKARLCVKSNESTAECVRMKLEAGEAGALRLSAGKNHVHVTGAKWKAQADRVDLGHDGHVVLTGHVKLVADSLGVCASVRAERLCVVVKGGKFEKIDGQR